MGDNGELSIVRFAFTNFWAVVIQTRPLQPTSTLLIKLMESLIASEPDPDPKHQKRVDWIYEHTSEEINMSLPIVELAVFKNMSKGLNCEIDLGEKTFYLVDLYKILDGISKELSTISIEIAKRYSFDFPTIPMGKAQSQDISFEN